MLKRRRYNRRWGGAIYLCVTYFIYLHIVISAGFEPTLDQPREAFPSSECFEQHGLLVVAQLWQVIGKVRGGWEIRNREGITTREPHGRISRAPCVSPHSHAGNYL